MPRDMVPLSPQLLRRLSSLGVDVGPQPPEVTTDEYFALWRRIAAAAERPDLGLAIGARAQTEAYSVSSIAALQAPTLGEALRTMARYKRLCCPEEIEIEVKDGEASVRCDWLFASGDVPDLLVDAIFASMTALAKRGTGGKVAPLRIELARKARHAAVLRAHFGCPIAFGTAADRIVFAESALAARFVTANAEAFARLVPGLEAQLLAGRRTRPLDDVRVAIARTIGAGLRPSIAVVADRLRTSPRTLQRRLGEADTTFQHQLDDVRRLSARRLLAHTELPPIDIAFLLGFAEPNSFARAFRTWERMTPLRWRAARS